MRELTHGDQYGIALRGKDATGAMTVLWTYLEQKAGPLYTEDQIKANLCSTGAKEVFNAYTQLYTVDKVTPLPTDNDYMAQLNLFAASKAAFLQNGSWMFMNIKAANPEMAGNYAVAPIPVFAGGTPVVQLDGMSLVIGKGSKNPQEAWNFIKYITDQQHQLENFQTTNFLPSLVALLEDPSIKNDPTASVFLSQMNQYGVPQPRSLHANEIWTIVTNEWHNALLGQKTSDQALDDACSQITALLK
jgi:ABC-type glycerol-3-phosphate transport system substrate-binding protein